MKNKGEHFFQRIAIIVSVIGTFFTIVGFGISAAIKARAKRSRSLFTKDDHGSDS